MGEIYLYGSGINYFCDFSRIGLKNICNFQANLSYDKLNIIEKNNKQIKIELIRETKKIDRYFNIDEYKIILTLKLRDIFTNIKVTSDLIVFDTKQHKLLKCIGKIPYISQPNISENFKNIFNSNFTYLTSYNKQSFSSKYLPALEKKYDHIACDNRFFDCEYSDLDKRIFCHACANKQNIGKQIIAEDSIVSYYKQNDCFNEYFVYCYYCDKSTKLYIYNEGSSSGGCCDHYDCITWNSYIKYLMLLSGLPYELISHILWFAQ